MNLNERNQLSKEDEKRPTLKEVINRAKMTRETQRMEYEDTRERSR